MDLLKLNQVIGAAAHIKLFFSLSCTGFCSIYIQIIPFVAQTSYSNVGQNDALISL